MFGSRQLGAWKINSISKRRASSSGLELVTALDVFRPWKNTCKTPWSISYSPVYFLCFISSDIGDLSGMFSSFGVQGFSIFSLAAEGLTIPRKLYSCTSVRVIAAPCRRYSGFLSRFELDNFALSLRPELGIVPFWGDVVRTGGNFRSTHSRPPLVFAQGRKNLFGHNGDTLRRGALKRSDFSDATPGGVRKAERKFEAPRSKKTSEGSRWHGGRFDEWRCSRNLHLSTVQRYRQRWPRVRPGVRGAGAGLTPRSNISVMRSVERRNLLRVAVVLPFASPLRSFSEVASPLGKPVFVAAGADATGTEHHGPRAGTHLAFKVLTKDTLAGFFLLEHRNVPQGGPVRHLHYAQEECSTSLRATRW